ncbi:MAG: thioesterase family protein [Myxococcota bacterium]|nr:thioesterase family protein [Myxococcota bacterium]
MNQVYVYPHRGRFQDIDAAGILFFARNFDYFHDAYLAFLEHLEMPLHEHLDDAEFVIPLVHAEADFAKPIRFGTRCDVHIEVARLGTSSFTLAYTLRGDGDRVLTTGQTVHCCVERATFASRALPERLSAALKPYQAATSP